MYQEYESTSPNVNFLKKGESFKKRKDTVNESITPDTDQGYLTKETQKLFYEEVIKKLEKIKTNSTVETVESKLMVDEDTIFNFILHKMFIKKYQYNNSDTCQVLRFGINIEDINLVEELNKFNNDLKNEIENSLSRKIETTSNISNVSGESKYTQFYQNHMKLTFSEKLVIKCAIDYMDISNDKVVLVDIFPRKLRNDNNDVGSIDIVKLDTHTALLYKTADNKILVLDPNNPIFTAHIAKIQEFGYIVETAISSNNKYKIYSRPMDSKTGYESQSYRDCIDIAVKLAFGLNSDNSNYQNLLEIIESQTIKYITNNSIIDQYSPAPVKDIPLRFKQSSDLKKVVEFNKGLARMFTIKTDAVKEKTLNYNNDCQNLKQKFDSDLESINKDYSTQLSSLESNISIAGTSDSDL